MVRDELAAETHTQVSPDLIATCVEPHRASDQR